MTVPATLAEALTMLADNTVGDISELDMREIITALFPDTQARPGTDTIQAAVDALPATGGKVLLKQGTYIIGGPVTITKPNVSIVGSGLATIIDITGATEGFVVSATGFRLKQCKVKLNNATGGLVGVDFIAGGTSGKVIDTDFENTLGVNTAYVRSVATKTQVFDSRAVVVAGSVTIAFQALTGATEASLLYVVADKSAGFSIQDANGSVDHCRVLGNVGVSILINGLSCHVTGCPQIEAGSSGIQVFEDKCVIDTCTVTFPQDATVCRGIEINLGANDCKVHQCWIDGAGNTGLSNGIHSLAQRTDVEGNRIENCLGTGINLNNGDEHLCNDNRVRSCGRGILATGCIKAIFNGNRCVLNTLDGLLLRTGSNRCNVIGNHCRDNLRDGITISGSSFCVVVGNHCNNNSNGGMLELLSADSNNFVGNHVQGNITTDLSITGPLSLGTGNFT